MHRNCEVGGIRNGSPLDHHAVTADNIAVKGGSQNLDSLPNSASNPVNEANWVHLIPSAFCLLALNAYLATGKALFTAGLNPLTMTILWAAVVMHFLN